MSNEEFREQIKAIVDEAKAHNYLDCVLNSDLDRAIANFERDIRDDERANVIDEYEYEYEDRY